jgi:hypothetical protein
MPYKIALINADDYPGLDHLDTVIDFMFMADILINFNTPITNDQGDVDYSRRRITLSYLKNWFIIDLLASLPLNLIMSVAIES